MNPSLSRRIVVFAVAGLLFAMDAASGLTAERSPEVEACVRRSVKYLQNSQMIISTSEPGLVAYAYLSAGESADSPHVKEQLELVLKKFSGEGYKPGLHHNYEAGVDAMALVAADREKHKAAIQMIADFLIKEQKSHGGWDYATIDYKGDTSISQYGTLGLWAAARAGVQIPIRVWDQAAQWHVRTQLQNGAFGYHPQSGDAGPKHSMTVAGIGSMAIARIYLSKYSPQSDPSGDDPETKTKKSDKAFGVLERVTAKDTPDQPAAPNVPVDTNYKPQVSRKELDGNIGRGMAWLKTQYTIDNPVGWPMYYLYGLERVCSLNGAEKIGNHDWYREGCEFMFKKQESDGGFSDLGGKVSGTCFAILFLTRATEKLVPNSPAIIKARAATYGGGVLAGGRGLPTDRANINVVDGQVKAKPLDTPLDKLLAELDNPKSDKIESAQAALVEAVQVGQREQLIGQKDLLLKLAKDARVDVRRTAFWALGRCNDLRVAPVLIQGLQDVDFDVAVEARNALCVLSRRPRGFGLPDDVVSKLPESTTLAEKEAEFEKWRQQDLGRWREWYQNIRPYSERDKLPD